MSIITKRYAEKLAKQGKATIERDGIVNDNGRQYQIVTRHDLQRVDHYKLPVSK